MNKKHLFLLLTVAISISVAFAASHWAEAQNATKRPHSQLAVVWTTADPYVAHRMVLMYVHASQQQKWFEENLVIVWGPSAKLLTEDKELQAKVKSMQKAGVRFQACIACANMYGVTEKLRDLDIEVKGMGKPLTQLLQDNNWKVLTF